MSITENSPFYNFPQENNYDISATTNRDKVPKEVIIVAVDHFSRKEIPMYALYFPSNNKSVFFDWVSVDPNNPWENTNKKFVLIPGRPPIVFFETNNEYNGIYCFAAGTKNINDYIGKDVLSLEEAINEFGKENIVVIKIGELNYD